MKENKGIINRITCTSRLDITPQALSDEILLNLLELDKVPMEVACVVKDTIDKHIIPEWKPMEEAV